MKTSKIVTLRCHNFTIENIEVVMRKELSAVIKKPTIAIFGGSATSGKINKSLLKALCTTIGTKLGKKKFNIILLGSPEIPVWIAKAAAKSGAAVWTFSDSQTPKTLANDYANISINTNLDHEFVNFLISYIADIGIMIDGEIGSLIKGAIMVDYEKPLICMKNTGGAASKLPEILRESVHNFQDLNLYEAETVSELMRVLSRLTDGKILLESRLQRVFNQIK